MTLPYALVVSPDSALQFTITPKAELENEDSSRFEMKLRNEQTNHLAFKVKTTQPRRYLVRPNQGIVAPGSSEIVSILLVDKDRQSLWSTYERLGQPGLDNSKDKFLVQSCTVTDDFASQFKNEPRADGGQYKKELVEALTSMWNKATSGTEIPVFNKKLHVKHIAGSVAASASVTSRSGGAAGLPTSFQEGKRNDADKMSPDQLQDEVTSLRRKYDELVAFSVNLTAERDILNNTLEQTKRDLNREISTRTVLEKQGFKPGTRSLDKKSGKGGGFSLMSLIFAMFITFVLAVKGTNSDSLEVLKDVPVLGDFLGFPCGADSPKHKRNKSGKDEL